MPSWSHDPYFSKPWPRVDDSGYINDLYLPCSGFQYRMDLQIDVRIPSGAYYYNSEIIFVVWIETPDCINDPLNSPFAQRVRMVATVVPGLQGSWWVENNSEKFTDHPVELNYYREYCLSYLLSQGMVTQAQYNSYVTADYKAWPVTIQRAASLYLQENPEFQYSLVYGARQGIVYNPSGGENYSGMSLFCTWQSPAYLVNLPRSSRVRISHKSAAGGILKYELSYRTYSGLHRVSVDKDKERRFFEIQESGKNVELNGSLNDTISTASLSADMPNPFSTEGSGPSILIDDKRNFNVAYSDGKDAVVNLSPNGKIGTDTVKLTWPGYSYLTLVGSKKKERPAGVFGIRNQVLCYRPIVGVGSRITSGVLGGTTLEVANPEKFTVGWATIEQGNYKGSVYISDITKVTTAMNNGTYRTVYTLTLASAISVGLNLADSSLPLANLLQDKFTGINHLYSEMYVTGTTTKYLMYPDMTVSVRTSGFVKSNRIDLGADKAYVFLQESTTGVFNITKTNGESKSQLVGATTLNVDSVPPNSLLIGVVSGGVLDQNYAGSVIMYKASEEYVGGLVDETGRVSVLAHKGSSELAASSEDGGYTWAWNRFE